MNRLLIILTICLLGVAPVQLLHAQDNLEDETLFILKNGDEVYGVIEKEDSLGVHLRIPGENYLVLAYDQIERREKPKQRFERFKTFNNWNNSSIYYPKKGFYFATDLGVNILRPEAINFNTPGLILHLRAGYTWRPYLQTGLAFGISGVPQGVVMPVLLEVGGNLAEKRISPIYRVQAGWSTGLNQAWAWLRTRGGPTGQVAFGWRIHNRTRVQISSMIGFTYQFVRQQETNRGFFPAPVVLGPGNPLHLMGLSYTMSINLL